MEKSEKAAPLAQWWALHNDKAALVESPEGHQQTLIERAESLHAQGVIGDGELVQDHIGRVDFAHL